MEAWGTSGAHAYGEGLLVAAATASITWTVTHSAGATVVAAVFAYVGLFLVTLPIAAVVDIRRGRRKE